VSGEPTPLADGTLVYNADQTGLSVGPAAYRSRPRVTPAVVNYGPAEAAPLRELAEDLLRFIRGKIKDESIARGHRKLLTTGQEDGQPVYRSS
jgi:hypothetical protein